MTKLKTICRSSFIAVAMIISSTAQGQSVLPPEVPAASIKRGSELRDLPFKDEGNASAKAIASQQGISVGEATSQLKRQWALNAFVARLEERRPDLFSFVSNRDGILSVALTDPNADLSGILPPGLGELRRIPAKYSRQSMYRKLDEVTNALKAIGIADVTVGLDPETGKLEFIAGANADAVKRAIAEGKVSVPGGYIVSDSAIVAAGGLYAGLSYNVDPAACSTYCNGTTGFTMMSKTTTDRYVSTAGHMEDGRPQYSTSLSGGYGGGTSLTFRADMRNSYNLDIQYAQPNDQTNNFPNPYFWDGSQYVLVNGWTYPTEAYQFCKFGRITGKDCGVHAKPYGYANSTWNVRYLEKIVKPASQSCSSFLQEGDSGGPIYYGTWAVGWVHGYDKTTCDIFYTPYTAMRNQVTPVDIIIAY